MAEDQPELQAHLHPPGEGPLNVSRSSPTIHEAADAERIDVILATQARLDGMRHVLKAFTMNTSHRQKLMWQISHLERQLLREIDRLP